MGTSLSRAGSQVLCLVWIFGIFEYYKHCDVKEPNRVRRVMNQRSFSPDLLTPSVACNFMLTKTLVNDCIRTDYIVFTFFSGLYLFFIINIIGNFHKINYEVSFSVCRSETWFQVWTRFQLNTEVGAFHLQFITMQFITIRLRADYLCQIDRIHFIDATLLQ